MAEDCPRSSSQYRSHPSPLLSELRSPDRIDPALDVMQTALLNPMLDRLSAQAQLKKLPPSNNSVLLSSQSPSLICQRLAI
ncbi:MAG TPA: hypothetical protein VF729_08655 [Solirubrobacterales bacterium]